VNEDSHRDVSQDRDQFLVIAGLFQSALLLLALGLGWWLEVDPWDHLHWTWTGCAYGVLATLPLMLLSVFLTTSRLQPVVRMQQAWVELLGPMLRQCHILDLLLLSLLVGISEEVLFRGVLQPWWGQSDLWTGLWLSNLVFGLAHVVTPTYAVLAMLVGMYLGSVMWLVDPPNLLIAILCHTGCDLFAFWQIQRQLLSTPDSTSPSSSSE
jgi:uncharacterized protein